MREPGILKIETKKTIRGVFRGGGKEDTPRLEFEKEKRKKKNVKSVDKGEKLANKILWGGRSEHF